MRLESSFAADRGWADVGDQVAPAAVLAALTALLDACRSRPSVDAYTPPPAPLGSTCFRLSFSPWSPEVKPQEMAWFMPPEVIALTPMPVEHPATPGSLRVLPDRDSAIPGQRVAFAEWHLTSAGGVDVLWGNGFTGVRLVFGKATNGLAGTAETLSDTPGGVYRSTANGKPTACTAKAMAAADW